MGNSRNNKIVLVILAVVMIICIAMYCVVSSHAIGRRLQENVSDRLVAMVEPNRVSFELQIEEQIQKVKTMAQYFGDEGNLGSESQVLLMRAAVEQNHLMRCALTLQDGSYITHDGKTGSIADMNFFLEAMQGKFNISEPRASVVDETKSVMMFTAPIWRGDQIVGALTYAYLCDSIDRIFNLEFLNGSGDLAIVNRDGEALIVQPGALERGINAITFLAEQCVHRTHAPEDCLPSAFSLGNDGSFTIEKENVSDDVVVYFEESSVNDWSLLAFAPEKIVNETVTYVSHAERNVATLVLCGVIVYILVFIGVRFIENRDRDKLTNAPRLQYFMRLARNMIKNHKDQRYIIVQLDIRDFKLINRVYNFVEGDRVIRNVSESLKKTLDGLDATYARISTDAFVIILPFEEREDLDKTRAQFIQQFYELMGPSFTTKVYFPTGQYITTYEDAVHTNMVEIMEKVNFAHSRAKRSAGDVVVDYEENIERESLLQKVIEDNMEMALQNGDYQLFMQAKFSVDKEEICGAEALVRWNVASKSLMFPKEFIPTLERNGFIVRLDMYMFEATARFLRFQMDEGIQPVPISVNFSRHHLNNVGFVRSLCAIADQYEVPHHLLEVELTESVASKNISAMIHLTDALHQAGFLLSLDDFGSGYSSLALLKDLHVDVVKIDQTLFAPAIDAARMVAVLQSICSLSHELHAKTVAEGIERRDQLDLLKELHCDAVQGFYFSKPVPAQEYHSVFFKQEAALQAECSE